MTNIKTTLTVIGIVWFVTIVTYLFVEYVGSGEINRWLNERYEDKELAKHIFYQGNTYRIYNFDIKEGKCYVVESINHDLSISCFKK